MYHFDFFLVEMFSLVAKILDFFLFVFFSTWTFSNHTDQSTFVEFVVFLPYDMYHFDFFMVI